MVWNLNKLQDSSSSSQTIMGLLAILIGLMALLQLVNSEEPFGIYPEEDSSLRYLDASGPSEILRWLLYRSCFSDPQNQPKFMQSPQKMEEFFKNFGEANAEKLLSMTWTLLGMKHGHHKDFRVCNLYPHKLNEKFLEVESESESEPETKCIQSLQISDEQAKQLRKLFNC